MFALTFERNGLDIGPIDVAGPKCGAERESDLQAIDFEGKEAENMAVASRKTFSARREAPKADTNGDEGGGVNATDEMQSVTPRVFSLPEEQTR